VEWYNLWKNKLFFIALIILFSYYNIHISYLIFSILIISYFIYFIFPDLHLKIYEVIPISFICLLILFVYIGGWYTFLKININILTTAGIFISIFLFTVNYKNSGYNKLNKKLLTEIISTHKSDTIIIFIILIIPIISLYKLILTHNYFMGYDPYRNEPLINIIISKNLDPYMLLNKRGIVHSGFFYSMLAINNIYDISIYDMTRYGWILIFSLVLMMLYLLMTDIKNSKFFIFTPLFFFANDFVLNRFVMTIRENLAFLFLILFIYFLNKNIINEVKGKIIISYIMGAIFVTHPLVFFYSTIILIIYTLFINKDIKNGVIIMIFSLLASIPYLYSISLWGIYTAIIYIQRLLHLPISLPFWRTESSLNSGWNRGIYLSDFNIFIIILAPIGSCISIINKKYRNILLSSFIPIILCTAIIYFLSSLNFNFTIARIIIYAALLLSMISSLVIVDLVLPLISKIFNRVGLKTNTICYFLVFLALIIPFTYSENNLFFNYYKWSPYEMDQVQDIKQYYKQTYNNKDIRIIAPPNDMGLLEYVGFEPLYAYRNEIITLLQCDNLLNFINDLNITKLHVVMSKRWLNQYINEYSLIKSLIADNAVVFEGEGIIVYECKICN